MCGLPVIIPSVQISDKLTRKIKNNIFEVFLESDQVNYTFHLTNRVVEILNNSYLSNDDTIIGDIVMVEFESVFLESITSRRDFYKFCIDHGFSVLSPLALLALLDQRCDKFFQLLIAFRARSIYIAMDPVKDNKGEHSILKVGIDDIDDINSVVPYKDLKNSFWLFFFTK